MKVKSFNIPVFIASNDEYSPFIATTITSLMENTSSHIEVFVLDDGISDKNKLILRNYFLKYPNLRIDFYPVDMTIFNTLSKGWFKNYTTYMRYLIPQMFPHINKCIYTDIDIIFNSDIEEAFNFDPQSHGICAAVDDGMYNTGLIDIDMEHHTSLLNINKNHIYFNAGFMIMNNDYWRANDVAEKLLDVAKINKDNIKCPSQDPLNIYFSNVGYINIPHEYNWMPLANRNNQYAKNYHFTGDKPWEFLHVFGADLFWKYARLTPYYEELLVSLINKQRLPEKVVKKISKLKKLKYKILSKITFGKIRNKYKNKYIKAIGK